MKIKSVKKTSLSAFPKFAVIVFVVAGILLMGNFFSYAGQNGSSPSKTSDEAVVNFIDTLAAGNKNIICEVDYDVIEKIKQAFGDDAWKNTSYDKIEGVSPYCEGIYLSNLSNEEISQQEYKRLLQEHVVRVCREHNIDPLHLSLKGPELLSLTPEETVERNLVIREISSTSPVRIETKSSIPYQYFQLSFYGLKESKEIGICNIRVCFIQKNGEWVYDHIYYDATDFYEEDV